MGHPGPSFSDNWLQSLWGLGIPVWSIGQTHTHTHQNTLRSTRPAFLRPHEEAAVSVLPNSPFLPPSLSTSILSILSYPSIFLPLPASIPSLLRNYNYEVNYVSFLHLLFSSFYQLLSLIFFLTSGRLHSLCVFPSPLCLPLYCLSSFLLYSLPKSSKAS